MSISLLAVENTKKPSIYCRIIALAQLFNKNWLYHNMVHVGLVINGEVIEALPDRGVTKHMLFESLRIQLGYDVWIVPIKESVDIDEGRYTPLLGLGYDWFNAIKAGIDIGNVTAKSNKKKWFCSALIAYLFGKKDYAEQTPSDVCAWKCWDWNRAKKVKAS